jgi:hypothetical protein
MADVDVSAGNNYELVVCRSAPASTKSVTVLGEGRTIAVMGGAWTGTFAGFQDHLYQLSA